MLYRIEVSPRDANQDTRARGLARTIWSQGFKAVREVQTSDLFFLKTSEPLSDEVQVRLAGLLSNEAVEVAAWCEVGDEPAPVEGARSVEVTLLPGVTDSVAESVLEGARVLGVELVEAAAKGTRYVLRGGDALDPDLASRLASRFMANEVIERWTLDEPAVPPFAPSVQGDGVCEVVALGELDDAGLVALSRARRLSLDLAEMRAIQAWFLGQGRAPTELELEMIAQTWSEHCVHKTFRAQVEYEARLADGRVERRVVDGLLKMLRAATQACERAWVRSAFVDNAGIIALCDGWDLAIKAETHNRPSALEPFGGANTGVGGVVRDILGVSARPVANYDALCFGPTELADEAVPVGVLHPRRVAEGVVHGIEDYGNKMGIPTVAGAVVYGLGYVANPLVFCGCVGVLPHGSHPNDPQVGDRLVCLGGKTGRDGLRGATFSSMGMTHETGQVSGSAVQIGHPICEKQVLEAVLQARDERLYRAITDCGAGGLSSAVGEMARELGARVELSTVPLKYPGLRPWEIWLSEAQERMVLAVPPDKLPRLQEIAAELGVEATDLGPLTGDGWLSICYEGREVGRLEGSFLHGGIPRRRLRAVWEEPSARPLDPAEHDAPDLGAALLALLASPPIRSREDIIRRYDHEVQAGTVGKPLVGPDGLGPGDGAVIVPLDVRMAHTGEGPLPGFALGVALNPRLQADPYLMAWAAVDEALRNIVAVGADPDRAALLDNFCWGDPTLEDRMGALVRCVEGCCDASKAFRAPFVSGKDSLYNEYTGPNQTRRAIPGTILISAVGVVPDARRAVSSYLKRAGSSLFVVGATRDELGGSAWAELVGADVGTLPQPVLQAPDHLRALHAALAQGLARACHDLSDGGFLVAVAEMALGGGLGARVDLAALPQEGEVSRLGRAFGESMSRFVVEVAPEDEAAFLGVLAGVPLARVGEVAGDALEVWEGAQRLAVIDVETLKTSFAGGAHPAPRIF